MEGPTPETSYEKGRRAGWPAAVLAALSGLLAAPARGAEDRSEDLAAIARAGARPTECGGDARERGSRWDRAKTPGLEHYCDALAKGYSALKAAPDAALAHAAVAARAEPGAAAPLVLAARAEVLLGHFAEGFSRFERAERISPVSLESPGALHDFAVAAERSLHPREALIAYRALVPRAGLLGDASEALTVLVEAASLAMSEGTDHLTEAVGYLTEARRMPKLPELADYLIGALALALDRQGRRSEAAGIAAESNGPWQLERERGDPAKPRLSSPVLPDGELDAMIATLAERRDPDLALERWQSYLDGPAGKASPFAAHARARQGAIKHGGKARR